MYNFLCLKISCVFLLFVLVAVSKCSVKNSELADTYCEGDDWIPYKDVKCVKLIKISSTRQQAKDLCDQEVSPADSSAPQLLSIKSAAEQEYLTKYLFDETGIEVNVWIGAKRVDEDGNNAFVWDDGSEIEYTNWAVDSPTANAKRACVVMQSEYTRGLNAIKSVNGKWKDVTCEQTNFVICEKLQHWSIKKLQQAILDTREHLQESLDKITNELKDTSAELSETKSELTATKNALNEVTSRVNNVEIEVSRNYSVLIGFIYTQLPNEKTPIEIFPFMTWEDVSATYAGVFFRVNGGNAAAFGQVQEDNAPRLDEVFMSDSANCKTGKCVTSWNVGFKVIRTGWSDGILTGVSSAGGLIFLQFKHSTGEVRPRNMAIRIWKRTA